MKFEDLHKIFKKEFKTDRLADISKELGVTPQVVSNWKSRNHVPYKYVKKLREIKKTLDNPIQNIYIDNNNDIAKEEDPVALIMFVTLYKKIIKKKNLFIGSFSFIMLVSIFYIKFMYEPLYVSVGFIMPIADESSSTGLGGLASQLGLGNVSNSKSVLSPDVYPQIVNSYSFLNKLLEQEYTYERNKKLKLINILMGSDSINNNLDDISRFEAVDILSSKIIMLVNRKTRMLTLRTTTNNPVLSKELASSIIKELDVTLKDYEKNQLKEKLDYITIRINEVSKELIHAEEKLKDFREKNRNIISPLLVLEEDRLLREVDVQVEIFTTLKTELELTQVNLIKRSNLILTLDPPRMPLYQANFTVFRIIIISALLGMLFSISLIYGLDWYNNNKIFIKDIYS